MDTTFIYALCEPNTGEIRYIGKADDPRKRFWRHVKDARFGIKDHKSCWIRSLLSKNKKPTLRILDEVPEDLWCSAEMGYIHFYRGAGNDLTNFLAGGDSGSIMLGEKHPRFGKTHTKETREKISKTKTGAPVSVETREILRQAGKTSALTLAQCKKMAEINRGKTRPRELIERIFAIKAFNREKRRCEEMLEEMWN